MYIYTSVRSFVKKITFKKTIDNKGAMWYPIIVKERRNTMIYAVFENGIKENEWWLLEAFLTLKEAKDYVDDMIEEDMDSRYRIVEYIESKVVKELG
jgi:hypothetical protein